MKIFIGQDLISFEIHPLLREPSIVRRNELSSENQFFSFTTTTYIHEYIYMNELKRIGHQFYLDVV